MLVGINLLREGLDIPECALVAILDADKEGFLRSETSLIQTIGRAARNVDGKVILYADRITGSMERAMAETDRRREKQVDYNTAHGITPESDQEEYRRHHRTASTSATMCWSRPATSGISATAATIGHNFEAVIADLEKRMREAAADLDFEEAARLRDEIKRLRATELGGDRQSGRETAFVGAAQAESRRDGAGRGIGPRQIVQPALDARARRHARRLEGQAALTARSEAAGYRRGEAADCPWQINLGGRPP